MSQLLQVATRSGALAQTVGTLAPAHYANGLPFDADGSLAVDTASAIDHYQLGLPFTAAGRLCVAAAAVDHFGSGGAPFTATGRLAQGTPTDHYSAGIPYTATGQVSTAGAAGNPELWTNPPSAISGTWVDNLDDTYTVSLSASLSNMTMTDILEIGQSYRTTITVSGTNGSLIHVRYNATNVLSVSTDGDHEITAVTDGVNLVIRATTDTAATVSGISVKKA